MTQIQNNETNTSLQFFENVLRKPALGTLKLYISRIPQKNIFQTMVHEGKELLSHNFDVVVAEDELRTTIDFPSDRVISCNKLIVGSEIITEMDYEGILERSPKIVIINDITHHNVSTSLKKKRCENVRILLNNGISVIASAYGSWDDSFDEMIRCAGGNFPVSSKKWSNLPLNETVALVFPPHSSFHHAELTTQFGK